MGQRTHRTWKSRDIQALPPLFFCRICGRELYRETPEEICGDCRAGLRGEAET